MEKNYDLVVIGAGSVGLPAALELALKGNKILVIESDGAPGQANNKKAIGGPDRTDRTPPREVVAVMAT